MVGAVVWQNAVGMQGHKFALFAHLLSALTAGPFALSLSSAVVWCCRANQLSC